jgi:hypothetical protein
MRKRVTAAVGAAPPACRSKKAVAPPASARSKSRREAVRSSARGAPRISATTAQTPFACTPSSTAHSISSTRRVRTRTTRAGSSPKRASPSALGDPASRPPSGSVTQSTAPARRAARQDSSAAAKPVSAPPARLSALVASCSVPQGMPAAANSPSKPATPVRRRAGPCPFAAEAGSGRSCASLERRPSRAATRLRSSTRSVRSGSGRGTATTFVPVMFS